MALRKVSIWSGFVLEWKSRKSTTTRRLEQRHRLLPPHWCGRGPSSHQIELRSGRHAVARQVVYQTVGGNGQDVMLSRFQKLALLGWKQRETGVCGHSPENAFKTCYPGHGAFHESVSVRKISPAAGCPRQAAAGIVLLFNRSLIGLCGLPHRDRSVCSRVFCSDWQGHVPVGNKTAFQSFLAHARDLPNPAIERAPLRSRQLSLARALRYAPVNV